MKSTILHITNGQSLTDYLSELKISGDILTWQEMMCEGPTSEQIDTNEFYAIRKSFLHDYYGIEVNEAELRNEISVLDHSENYSEIVLWFEYDLFCHINLMAVINLLQQKKIKLPIYLVCSGWVEGEKNLKGLAELNPEQLQKHYASKIKLTIDDIDLMKSLWNTYCGKDHNLFKPMIVKNSSFKYLSNCLKAHLTRFPNSETGLSVLEKNTLELLQQFSIKSRKHLLGYVLHYQGYYGFGDIQIMKMIDNLSIFYDESIESIKLNQKGAEVLLEHHNCFSELNNVISFGGVNNLEFQFSEKENKLIKTE